ncbi:diguanylate cyclase [Malonomonas rubra]|uniref:diguanylate cyclase domain-containing protein n=1 Tax=Malonomonas rubra TaxID=57040 RepID=UPI0034E96E73
MLIPTPAYQGIPVSIANCRDWSISLPAIPASIYADLDNFKAYNDNYGFAKGDEFIIFTANVIRG